MRGVAWVAASFLLPFLTSVRGEWEVQSQNTSLLSTVSSGEWVPYLKKSAEAWPEENTENDPETWISFIGNPQITTNVNGVVNQQKRPNKPVYVEHVMKCGGTSLCQDLSQHFECNTTHLKNCRPDSVENRFKAVVGKDWRDPSITSEEAKMGMETFDDPLCGLAFNEPAYLKRTERNFEPMARYKDLESKFWDAYTTMLLVRDPWERYLSHLLQWSFIHHFQFHDDKPAPDIILSDSDKVFGSYEVKVLRKNFITQHLVPGFRRNPSVCTEKVLQSAKRAVDRFDIVLDFKGLPIESASILEAQFGLHATPPAEGDRITGVIWPPPSEHQAIKFKSINECDYKLLEYARKKIIKKYQKLK
eukprot:jgi/Bigna1/79049/fgenesh1_pg.59_\